MYRTKKYCFNEIKPKLLRFIKNLQYCTVAHTVDYY